MFARESRSRQQTRSPHSEDSFPMRDKAAVDYVRTSSVYVYMYVHSGMTDCI